MAASMNVITLIGRLTRDPELNRTQSGVPYVRFSVAVDRPLTRDAAANNQQRAVDFIPCVAWNKTAENISQYCHKGSLVAVNGSLRMSQYQDKQNPEVKRTSFDVRAANVQFLTPKSADNANAGNGGGYNGYNNNGYANTNTNANAGNGGGYNSYNNNGYNNTNANANAGNGGGYNGYNNNGYNNTNTNANANVGDNAPVADSYDDPYSGFGDDIQF